METVCENEAPVPHQVESETTLSCRKDSVGGEDTVGAIPPMRGVRRLKSSTPVPGGRLASASGGLQSMQQPSRNGVERASSMRVAARPLANSTKLTDAATSLRGSAVARANSSRALLRATSNNIGARPRAGGPPSRTNSAQGLRPFNRDQIVNTSISRKGSIEGLQQMRGPGGTLQRHESDMSMDGISMGDGSLFTMDSVLLRKGQMVADPFDDGTYDEQGSFADHESFVTRDEDNLYGGGVPHHHTQAPAITFGDLEQLRLTQRLNISSGDDHSEVSFGTMASGLTTDFTEHDYSEYACDETEQAE